MLCAYRYIESSANSLHLFIVVLYEWKQTNKQSARPPASSGVVFAKFLHIFTDALPLLQSLFRFDTLSVSRFIRVIIGFPRIVANSVLVRRALILAGAKLQFNKLC